MPSKHAPRLRNALFTHFRTEVPIEKLEFMDYLVYQLEECPETRRTHYQGYAEFSQQMTLKKLQEWLPSVHFEKRFGNQAQAIAYCTKEDTRVDGPWEYGERPREEGN